MANNLTLSAAIQYHRLGWSIIPLKPMSKAACVRWTPYQTKLATVGELTHWLVQSPDAGLAIITGQLSGVVVVDIDGPIYSHYVAALATIETPQVATKRGVHLYFEHPRQKLTNRILAPNFELKAQNALATLPPSKHPSGKTYRWVLSPFQTALAPLPQWIIELSRPIVITPRPSTLNSTQHYHAIYIERYANAALNRSLESVQKAAEGVRNKTLNAAALSLGELVGAGALSKSMVESSLLGVALAIGLPDYEARRTIRSGLTKGMLSPRDLSQIKPK